MSDEREAINFAGFEDAGVPSSNERKGSKAETDSRGHEKPKQSTSVPAAPKTTSGGDAGTVVAWFLGIGCVIVLLAIFDSSGDRPKPRQAPPPAPTASREPTPMESPVVVQTREQQPPVGVEVLTRRQLRWCVFWDWRINQLAQIVVDEPMFPAFNRLVDDYNSRCVNASYYETDMGAVQPELAGYEAELRVSVTSLHREWSQRYLVPVVLDIQRSLTQLGYDPGPVDGLIGPKTRNAIRQIEQDYGIEPTGQASIALRDALGQVAAGR